MKYVNTLILPWLSQVTFYFSLRCKNMYVESKNGKTKSMPFSITTSDNGLIKLQFIFPSICFVVMELADRE